MMRHRRGHSRHKTAFLRQVQRDDCRRRLATNIVTSVNGPPVEVFDCSHDAIGRPVSRNGDAFGYNARSEVIFSRRAAENAEETYSYDEIGNLLSFAAPAVTNAYAANNLNQYVSISSLCGSAPLRELSYDPDGNLTQCGDWTYTYDAANRLVSVASNGLTVATFAYDAQSRRVKKVTPEATHTYFYDGWNLVEERMSFTNGTTSTIHYHWGKDLSGSLQDAGGIGGLLYISIDGALYVPCYDNNGNITRYLDSTGSVVATYIYDSFGRTLSSSGPLANVFRHRFSTKYCDPETGLYYYGYRFFIPYLMRWLNRDPVAEEGGLNLYSFCLNAPSLSQDFLGLRNLCDCLSIQVRVSRRCNWSSVFAAKRFFYVVLNDAAFTHTTRETGHGFIPHYDSLEQLEVLVDMLDAGKDSCCATVGYSTFVTIDSVGFHVNKSPWSYGHTMEGKKFTNNHVTANLIPNGPEGFQKTFKIRVWIDSEEGEEDCLNRSVTVRY